MTMRYKLLGKSGLRVSELALGTMTFGEEWGWGASKEECHKMFDAYAHAGGNFIDTANRYTEGTAERIVGELIAADRAHFVLASKYTLKMRNGDPNYCGNHRKNMVQSLEASLKRLHTDYLDMFWVHAWDFLTPVEEVMRGLDDLVRAGKVLYIGISDTPAWVVAQANTLADLRGWTSFIGIQAQYSLIERTPERELLPMARALGYRRAPLGHPRGGRAHREVQPWRRRRRARFPLGLDQPALAADRRSGAAGSRRGDRHALPGGNRLGARASRGDHPDHGSAQPGAAAG